MIKLTKFIAATGGVLNLQLHSDNSRLAVMLPHNTSLEIWDINMVTRLHRFTLTPDATFMVWRKDFLLVAPLYSGVIQIFNTSYSNYEESGNLVGKFRKIDALATYENLVATAEDKQVRLWKISPASTLMSWTATKTAITSIYMNDTMIGNERKQSSGNNSMSLLYSDGICGWNSQDLGSLLPPSSVNLCVSSEED